MSVKHFVLIATLVAGAFVLLGGCRTVSPVVEEEVPPRIAEPAPPAPEEEEESFLDALRTAVEAGDAKRAVAIFEEARADGAEDAGSGLLFAHLLLSAGDFGLARAELLSLLEAVPDDVEVLFALSIAEGALGDVKGQERALTRILELDRDDARAYAALGEIHLAARRTAAAREAFRASLARDPDNVAALVGYGRLLLGDGDAAGALERLDRAAELQSDFAVIFADRARARAELNDLAGAEADLGRAIELEPGSYWNHIDRGRLRLLGIGDVAGALEDFDRAVGIDGRLFYAYAFRAGIHDRFDRIEEAIADYRTVLRLRPDYYPAHAPLAVLLYMAGEWSASREMFRKAHDADQSEPGYPLMVALTYRREGANREAARYLETAAARLPRESPFYHMARLYMEPGYDGHVTALVGRERDASVKYRLLFYLASHYLISGQTSLAYKFFLDVRDEGFPGMYERRLAAWELDRRGTE